MTPEKIDPAAVLAFLEAKIAALQAVAASWKKALELGALGPTRFPRLPGEPVTGTNSTSTGEPIELPAGALSNKNLPEAIKLYLSAVRKKQTNKEIEAALKEGGVESTASKFSSSVAGALFRLKESGEVLRFKDGWGLAELYPEHLRAKLSQDNKQIAKRKSAKGGKNKRVARALKPEITSHPEGLEQRIEAILKADHSKAYLPREIAQTLQVERPGIVVMALGRMARKNKAEKIPGGKYRSSTSGNPQEMPKAI